MRYRYILLDFDGTLADSFACFLRVFNQLAEQFAFRPLDTAQLATMRGASAREVVAHTGLPLWKIPRVMAEGRRLMGVEAGSIRLFDGIAPVLERLAEEGVQLAIVSSNSETSIRRILGPLSGHMRHFACGASLYGKAARLRKAARACGAGPNSEVLCVGDEIRDAEAAAEAGFAFAPVMWGYTAPEGFNRVPQVARLARPEDLLTLVLGEGKSVSA